MIPAAKHGDVEIGVDIHLYTIPSVPPVVMPLPTPHMSVLFDPMDLLPFVGATVSVHGMKSGKATSSGMVVHIPMGVYTKPPETDDEVFMGSRTVYADGSPMSHIGHPVMSCQVSGNMPTSFNLATPTAVFIGGPPTIDMMAMLMKVGFALLGKFAKSGMFQRARKWVADRLGLKSPGFLRCIILRAEPVNILSGAVTVQQSDFSLPGRLPLEWRRDYRSDLDHVGVLGKGWQTMLDIRLVQDAETGHAFVFGPDFGLLAFERLPHEGEPPQRELMDGSTLRDTGDEYIARTKAGLIYHFPKRLPLPAQAGVTQGWRIGRMADRCGNSFEFEHRGGLVERIHLGQQRHLALAYQGRRLTAVTLVDQATGSEHPYVRYSHDGSGDLVSVIDVMGEPYRFAYEQHHMVRHTDRNGLSFHYDYDKNGPEGWRVTHAWGDGGLHDFHFDYDDICRQRRITDPAGNVTLVTLDERGLPLSEIDPLGGMTIYEYDDAGRCTAEVDPGGLRTEMAFDERGNQIRLTRADGTSVLTEFDADNNPICVTDPNGAKWQQQFDGRGLLQSQTTPLGHATHYTWDATGLLQTVVNPRGARTVLSHDALGHLSTLMDALGHQTHFQHDAFGNLLAKTDALGHVTRYRYDAKGRLCEARKPSGATITCGYDAEDNLTRYVDENGAETRLEYIGQGEIARRLQPDGHSVRYHYDAEERLVGVSNQRGETYTLNRDALGRVIEEVDYWGQSKRFRYDASGYLQWIQDQRNRSIEYSCDELGRVLRKAYDDERSCIAGKTAKFVETFEYDAAGNICNAANPDVQVTRSYDVEGRMVEEVQAQASGYIFVVRNTYDEIGNRTKRVIDSGDGVSQKTGTSFDLLNQSIETCIDEASPVYSQRDELGRIIAEELAAGIMRRFGYNADGLLAEQAVVVGGNTRFATKFGYDRAGNLTHRHDSQFGTDRYQYDPMGRIHEHIDPHGDVEMFFADPTGDRLATKVINDEQLKYADSGTREIWCREGQYRGARYRFDRAGNLSTKTDNKSILELTWNANQCLTISTINTGDLRCSTIYGYDPFGRRLFKETSGERVSFGWDGDTLAQHSTVQSTQLYDYRSRTFVPFFVRETIRSQQEVAHYLFDNDLMGCPSRLIDGAGVIVWAANPVICGEPKEQDLSNISQPLRLQGQFFDAETGLYYNRYRYYDENLSAFISPDPLGLCAKINIYDYAPNVFGYVDPFGLNNCKWTSKDPHVAEIANAIEERYPGHVKGVNAIVDGHEVDIVLGNAIIEVKSGNGRGLTKQVTDRSGIGLPVIGHAPDLGPSTARSINEAGGIASGGRQGTLGSLIDLVKPDG